MNKYFLNELDSIRETAQEFSKSNPTLAPQLSQGSADPDVERILEGVAFLTAGIRQKIDDDFPEFSQGLLNQVFPHYLRPLPSATIIEFKPTPILKTAMTAPAGTYLDSVEVDDVRCRYRTISDVDVSPLSITSAQATKSSSDRRAIDIVFNGMGLSGGKADNMRILVSGDYQGAVDIFFILNRYVDSIALLNAKGDEISGPDMCVEPVGFEDDFRLLDYPSNSFPAYRLIQEYYLLKEKFLFFRIKNISRYLSQAGGGGFTLRFYLKDLPIQIPRISPGRFVLHAVPAVNLFKHEAEAFLNDHKRSEYLLRPTRNANNQYRIYTVDKVIGNNRKSAQKYEYTKMGLFDPETNTAPVFQIYTRAQGNSEAASYISFSYPKTFDLESKESVQVELTCSNGSYTSKLKAGDINKKTSTSSEMIDFTNIIAPSPNLDAPTGTSVLWRLLSHLAINYLSLADADNLKSLLELYIFSGQSGSEQAIANRKRIDGITDVAVKSCDRLIGGMTVRGQTVRVTVSANHFSSNGDMYLFGMLLDRLIGSFASLNSFTEFSLVNGSTDEVFSWPLRAGDAPLI